MLFTLLPTPGRLDSRRTQDDELWKANTLKQDNDVLLTIDNDSYLLPAADLGAVNKNDPTRSGQLYNVMIDLVSN